jgi:hypothetical protein
MLAEYDISLREFILKLNRSVLTASQGDIRRLFSQSESSRQPTLFWARIMAGDALDDRIINTIHCEFIIRG